MIATHNSPEILEDCQIQCVRVCIATMLNYYTNYSLGSVKRNAAIKLSVMLRTVILTAKSTVMM